MNKYNLKIVEVFWFIDGLKGSKEYPRHFGSDFILVCAEESELLVSCENFVDFSGQGGNHYSFYDENFTSMINTSNFSSTYWSYNNVNNFGLKDFKVIKNFESLKDLEEKTSELQKEVILNAVLRQRYF